MSSLFLHGMMLILSTIPFLRRIIHSGLENTLEKLVRFRVIFYVPILLFCILTGLIAVLVYRKMPVVNDTSGYLFQAKIFAAGKLYAPPPPESESFSYEYDMLIAHDGKWFSMFPPGFPLMMAIAMWFRAEWFLGPVLGTITLLIWMAYVRRWHSKPLSLWFAVLFVFSPFLFQMYSTLLVHGAELFLASAIIYLCRRGLEEDSWLPKILLFLLLALGVMVRAFSLLIFLAPILLYTTWRSIGGLFKAGSRVSFVLPVVIALGVLAGGGLLALYQAELTGGPLLAPYSLEYPDLQYGFGKHFAGLTHSPARAVEQLSNSLLAMNQWLNGWYTGSFFVLIGFFLTVRKLETWDKLFLACCLSLLLFYFFYIAQDLIFGPRFIFLFAPVLLLWIAKACFDKENPSSGVFCAITLISFVSFFPFQFSKFIWIYDPANDPPEYLAERLHETVPEKKIVFIDPQLPQDYINWNDPFLREPVLFCRDLGEDQNKKVSDAFPDHQQLYFRPKDLTMNNPDPKSIYGFFPEADRQDHSRISFFELSAALQYSQVHTDLDSFDVTYPRLFYTWDAAPRLAFLDSQQRATGGNPTFQSYFRLALIHTARMLLLPRLAYEKGGFDRWQKHFDMPLFRDELQRAINAFQKSGDIGARFLADTLKVERRIDADQNGELSDQEIIRFLNEKILLFARFV